MKAAVVRSFAEPLVIEDRPVPTPAGHQVLVRMETSGLCHNDIHAAQGDWPVKPSPPMPETRARVPGRTPDSLTALCVVTPAQVRGAASSGSTPSGRGTHSCAWWTAPATPATGAA
jgi:threonine dehydrogenase-like Zn-dependent dehydrogenase